MYVDKVCMENLTLPGSQRKIYFSDRLNNLCTQLLLTQHNLKKKLQKINLTFTAENTSNPGLPESPFCPLSPDLPYENNYTNKYSY